MFDRIIIDSNYKNININKIISSLKPKGILRICSEKATYKDFFEKYQKDIGRHMYIRYSRLEKEKWHLYNWHSYSNGSTSWTIKEKNIFGPFVKKTTIDSYFSIKRAKYKMILCLGRAHSLRGLDKNSLMVDYCPNTIPDIIADIRSNRFWKKMGNKKFDSITLSYPSSKAQQDITLFKKIYEHLKKNGVFNHTNLFPILWAGSTIDTKNNIKFLLKLIGFKNIKFKKNKIKWLDDDKNFITTAIK
jgi:hypothetical protein